MEKINFQDFQATKFLPPTNYLYPSIKILNLLTYPRMRKNISHFQVIGRALNFRPHIVFSDLLVTQKLHIELPAHC